MQYVSCLRQPSLSQHAAPQRFNRRIISRQLNVLSPVLRYVPWTSTRSVGFLMMVHLKVFPMDAMLAPTRKSSVISLENVTDQTQLRFYSLKKFVWLLFIEPLDKVFQVGKSTRKSGAPDRAPLLREKELIVQIQLSRPLFTRGCRYESALSFFPAGLSSFKLKSKYTIFSLGKWLMNVPGWGFVSEAVLRQHVEKQLS